MAPKELAVKCCQDGFEAQPAIAAKASANVNLVNGGLITGIAPKSQRMEAVNLRGSGLNTLIEVKQANSTPR